MIFLTVGTHEPFDRLVRAVDGWTAERDLGDRVFGQITDRAGYAPKAFRSVPNVDPAEFRDLCTNAEFIISHAGMGSILSALTIGTQIVVMPRRGHLGETRNDHQFDTVQRLGSRPGIHVAPTEDDLPALLDNMVEASEHHEHARIARFADDRLITAIRRFIQDDRQGI